MTRYGQAHGQASHHSYEAGNRSYWEGIENQWRCGVQIRGDRNDTIDVLNGLKALEFRAVGYVGTDPM